MAKIKIPEWDDVQAKAKQGGQLSALERFVYDNEPAGASDEMFRQQLGDVLLEQKGYHTKNCQCPWCKMPF